MNYINILLAKINHFNSKMADSNYLKPSYFSGTLILAILARALVNAKFNTR